MNKIIIKAETDKYFFKQLKSNLPIYEMYKIKIDYISLFHKKLKKPIMILGNWKKIIHNCDCAIIFDSMYDPYISRVIKKKNPNCKTILFFWNKIESQERKDFLKDRNIDEFWTFDKKDKEKYHLNYNSQFYSKEIKQKNKNNKYDIYFFGREKNRKEKIMEWNKYFQNMKLNTKIEFLKDEKDFIDYDTYLENVFESRCLLDYNIENQIGLSLRCMEALFFQKKCITNNKDIIHYDFYHPNNFFILGKDDKSKLKEFMEKPYHKIKKDIIENYDIQNWLDRF